MSLTSAALVTLADVKTFLGLNNISDKDAVLETIIESVSAAFDNEVDADFKSATYTASKLDGNGRTYFYLPHFPVTAMTTVVEDGTTLVKDTDYFVDYDNGILEKAKYSWPDYQYQALWTTSTQGVVVTYTAGYASVPADVKLACLIEVGRAMEMVEHRMFGESSRTVDGTSITLDTAELLPSTMTVLARYTRTRI